MTEINTAPGITSDQPRAADMKEPTNLSVPLYDLAARAVKVLTDHPELPVGFMFSVSTEALCVSPWLIGEPMTALMMWHDAMTEVEREYEYITDVTHPCCRVTLRGYLADVPVIAQTVTFQMLSGELGRLPEEVLRVAARNERL